MREGGGEQEAPSAGERRRNEGTASSGACVRGREGKKYSCHLLHGCMQLKVE